MRTYSESDSKIYPIAFFLILWLAIKAVDLVFLSYYNTFSCRDTYCREQVKTGFFGKTQYGDFLKREDIVDIDVKSRYHVRTGKHEYSHDDYSPVLVMKDGTRHELKLQYCKGKESAINLIVKIRGNKNFKETTIN